MNDTTFDAKATYFYVLKNVEKMIEFLGRFETESEAKSFAAQHEGSRVQCSTSLKDWDRVVLYVREFITPYNKPIIKDELLAVGFYEQPLRVFEQMRNDQISWWNNQLDPPAKYK